MSDSKQSVSTPKTTRLVSVSLQNIFTRRNPPPNDNMILSDFHRICLCVNLLLVLIDDIILMNVISGAR